MKSLYESKTLAELMESVESELNIKDCRKIVNDWLHSYFTNETGKWDETEESYYTSDFFPVVIDVEIHAAYVLVRVDGKKEDGRCNNGSDTWDAIMRFAYSEYTPQDIIDLIKQGVYNHLLASKYWI